MSLRNDLENRLADDESERDSRLAEYGVKDIELYYWGNKAEFGARGLSARPKPGKSVWRQLLLTPSLIVDIIPCSAKKFVEYYGMDVTQMRILVERGYIIPNFYHYKNNGWQDYLKFPSVARFLANHGRSNTKWIQDYLEIRHNFEDIENEKIAFFTRINNEVEDREAKQLIEASHGRIVDWETFAGMYGRRLAYLQTLGGNDLEGVVKWIEDSYQVPHLRVTAIRLLNAAKFSLVSETTAAFGGQYTYDEDHVKDFRSSLPYLRQLAPGLKLEDLTLQEGLSSEALAYAQDVIRRLNKVEFPRVLQITEPKTDKLAKQAFDDLLILLDRLKREEGPLGRHINNMTEEIMRKGQDLEPTLAAYRKLEAEIESEFWRLGSLRTATQNLGSILTHFAGMDPSGYSDPIRSGLTYASGLVADFLVSFQKEKQEFIPAFPFRSRPKRLFADWRTVKQVLLNPATDRVDER